MAVVAQGRPRHHKHKGAATGPPKNVNVYNMHVQKMGEDNKVTGQLDAHNVAVSMQGPGVISLTTTQQQVAPGTESPDHTISVMKDTQGHQSSQVMNVHSGHELPVVLPLSETPTSQAPPKQAKPHDALPASQPEEPAKLHTKPQPKAASHKQQETHEPQVSHEPSLHVHHKVNKEMAGKVLANLESSIPVVNRNHRPKHEEPVVNGHKIKLTNGGEPQKVFGQVDSNNVALTVHGPGSASVSSHIKQGSQTVIFDPSPYDPCPGKKCPQGNGTNRTKE